MSRLVIIVLIAAFAADAFAAGVAFADLSGLWLRQDVLNEWWFIVVVGLVVVAAVSVVMVVVGFWLRDLAVACWDFFIRHTSDRVRATLTILASGYALHTSWEWYRAGETLYSAFALVSASLFFTAVVLWPILQAFLALCAKGDAFQAKYEMGLREMESQIRSLAVAQAPVSPLRDRLVVITGDRTDQDALVATAGLRKTGT